METYCTKNVMSELLEDAGNSRRRISLLPLSESLFSEQQKLRHVLDWADSFISSGSEIHQEICRADHLILAVAKQGEIKRSAENNHPISCTAGRNEEFQGRGSIEKVWPENRETGRMKSMDGLHITNNQTPSQDRRSRLYTSNQRHHTNISDSTVSGAGNSDSTDMIYETAEALSHGENQIVMRKDVEKKKTDDGRMVEKDGIMHKEQESSSASVIYTDDNMTHNERKAVAKHMAKTANTAFSYNLKLSSNLSIYEQYQFCVDQLHHLRMRQSQHTESGCSTESPENQRKTPEESTAAALPMSSLEFNSSTTNPEIKKHLNKVQCKRVTAAEITKEGSSDIINKNQDRTTYCRNRTTLTEHGETKETSAEPSPESRLLRQKNTSTAHLDLNGNNRDYLIKETPETRTSTDEVINTPMERLRAASDDVKESAALLANPVSLSKQTEHYEAIKGHRGDVKGQKKRSEHWGPWKPQQQINLQSAGAATHTTKLNPQTHSKRHTPEDRMKHTSLSRDKHRCLEPAETHTLPHDDLRPTSPSLGKTDHGDTNNTDYKHRPAGVPVCDRWLRLPDEVWLCILSLLPHRDLCRVLQVCSRLHTLAMDHTLWKSLRIEDSTLTERWLLFVGNCRPRSLCLYSCSSLSVTSCGLNTFFTLCRNSLEEIKVTSCTGPDLHGDQILLLIGQLCERVISVDVSWSGATDTGVKALSDSCTRLKLRSVVLNGCHVSDDPLKKLIIRHKESLCRLEVFGCQFLTPSCLQSVYEMCPGLQHLNIGQVPKVNTRCLTVMTSQLKCLISLNVTGLQAVTDATLDTLLQNCVKLQSLTLSFCRGVTDLTLHNISKYTPCIRSLDVSGCKAVTDIGVQSIALGCGRLQQLDLSSTSTGNRGVTLLANYCNGHLHTVKLSFCQITLENILKLCRRCKRLNVLHLYGCAHLPTAREIREINATVKVYPVL
uniref:uncharacterized protein LOC109961559 isoform X2 n=1 Tax=Monopterus albus TaxID=43700 RepID=UPI0009B41473|nr:uncharacterized protein LOC109961559 isoform X2 [Monopterus albus]